MGLITFARVAAPSGSWSPTHNPNYGDGFVRAIRFHQSKNISDGGDVYCYHKGESELVTLRWAALPSADLANLLSFLGTMCGARYTFTYTDPDAAAHTARLFNSDGLVYHEIGGGRHEVQLAMAVY